MYQSYVSQLIFEMELHGYSPRTIHSYSKYLSRFLNLTNKPISEITEEDLRQYLHSLVCRKVSTAFINSVYSSSQLFFTHVLKRSLDMQNIPCVKNSKKLPSVFKAVFKYADHVIKYLGHYTHRVAISDFRIKDISNNQVSFSYHDNKDGGKQKLMTLSSNEFMKRFLLHILPHKFVKIRHYEFLSNRFRSSKVALCRKLIAKQRGVVLRIVPILDKVSLLEKLIGKEKLCCPKCGRYFVYNHEVNLNYVMYDRVIPTI